MVKFLEDRKIIELFYERSEDAIIELSNKYGSLCERVANNILNSRLDTEECVNGVFESGDIASITPTQSKNTFKATGKAITDSDMISEFYNEIISLEAYSQEEHHDLVFANELAKAEGTGGDIGTVVYTGFADDHHNILIETKSGIKFNIDYYPSYGWIYTSETMSFYKMTASISKWFSDNL